MTQFVGFDLHTDDKGTKTSRSWGDIGNGTDDWYGWERIADGGSVALGALADTAATDHTTSETVISLLKGLLRATRVDATALLKLEDSAAVSGDAGISSLAVRRDTPGTGIGADGDYANFELDSTGYQRVVNKHDPLDTVSHTSNTAEAASLIVNAGAGVLHGIVGYIAVGEDGWLQVHNTTTVPADSAVPVLSYSIEASSQAQPVNIPLPGFNLSTGITLVWSTTGPTKTAGGTKMMVTGFYK